MPGLLLDDVGHDGLRPAARARAQRALPVRRAQADAPLRTLARDCCRQRARSGLVSARRAALLRNFVACSRDHERGTGRHRHRTRRPSTPIRGISRIPPTTVIDEDDGAGDAEPAAPGPYLAGRGVPFRRRHRLYGPIALYGGRVEPDNGCQEMLDYFDGYASTDGDAAARADGREDDAGARGALPASGRHAAGARAHDRVRGRRRDDRAQRPTTCWRSRCSRAWPSARRCSPAPATPRPSRTAAAPTPDCTTRTARSSSRPCGSWHSNPALRQRLGENGRRYVEQHYRWDAVIARFERLIGRVR